MNKKKIYFAGIFVSLTLLFLFRYQILYAIAPIIAIDEVFGKLHERERQYINFYSPKFSFKLLTGGAAGDMKLTEYHDDNTFILTHWAECENTIFDNVDPETLTFKRYTKYPWHPSAGYAKDKNKAFYFACDGVVPMQDINPSSIQELEMNSHYATDGINVYFNGSKIDETVYANFKIIKDSSLYSYDGKNAYYSGVKVQSASPTNLSLLGRYDNYLTDDTNIFFHDRLIEKVNLITFKVIDSNNAWEKYAQDNKNVYYEGARIEGTDPKTFRIINNLPNIDTYAADDMSIFFKGIEVVGADPVSFKLALPKSREFDAEDEFHKYIKGVRVD